MNQFLLVLVHLICRPACAHINSTNVVLLSNSLLFLFCSLMFATNKYNLTEVQRQTQDLRKSVCSGCWSCQLFEDLVSKLVTETFSCLTLKVKSDILSYQIVQGARKKLGVAEFLGSNLHKVQIF